MPLWLKMIVNLIFTIGGFALLAWLHIPIMIKKQWWRDLTLYIIIFTIAFYYTLAYVMRWPFLDPVKTATVLMKNIYQALGYNAP